MNHLVSETAALAAFERLPMEAFSKKLREALSLQGRVLTYFGLKGKTGAELFCVLAGKDNGLSLLSAAAGAEAVSLTPLFPQLHLFEREIAEQTGLIFTGHPWPHPVRYPSSKKPGVCDFFRVRGREIHEVAVGPVHAGVIEPGHFRFQCHGEKVFHLQIELGYQHRGLEKKLKGGPDKKTVHYMETAAGDTTIGHTWTYAKNIEALSGTAVPERADFLRAIMLELERMANHAGDLGALSGDVAYLPTSAFCGRIRGDILNITALVCGNRFGRNFIIPGGVNFDIDESLKTEIKKRLENTFLDLQNAVSLLWETKSVTERFRGTGYISRETAAMLGLVGPAARACGINNDARIFFPAGAYKKFMRGLPDFRADGDVYSRARVRWLELENSFGFINSLLDTLPEGKIFEKTGPLKNNSFAISVTEGWRGEVCHAVLTDENGKFAHYKITDPSFHNWQGLAMALRNGEISDFPLCNKSFNLSYCGHDL